MQTNFCQIKKDRLKERKKCEQSFAKTINNAGGKVIKWAKVMVLTVGNFHFPPFTFISVDPSTGEKSYAGIDVAILRLVAAVLGHELRFQSPSDGGNWGTVFANGTSTGLIGDVIADVVDVGSAEFFIQSRRIAYADPSSFYFFDYFCFILSKPPKSPRWMHMLMPFTTESWIAVIISWVVTASFYCLLTAVTGRQDYGKMLLESLSYFINQPVKLGTTWVQQPVCWRLCCHIIIALTFAADLEVPGCPKESWQWLVESSL